MKSPTWHAEEALLLLMSGGFFVQLINASRHLRNDRSQVADILLRPVDLALFLLMAHCAIALIVRSGQFARTYDLTASGRKLGYWAITAYVTLSLPGHILFLLTGDTRFFDAFPWWFSLVILPVYVLVVVYVVTLRRRPVGVPPTPPEQVGRTQGMTGQPVAAMPSPAGWQGRSTSGSPRWCAPSLRRPRLRSWAMSWCGGIGTQAVRHGRGGDPVSPARSLTLLAQCACEETRHE